MSQALWTIVLAAGSGRRLSAVTAGVPKQYWRDRHGRTLLEDTLDRVAPFAAPDHTVIVVDRSHAWYVGELPALAAYEHVVFQPRDRGTANGVLLGLIDVVSRDPGAMVLLTPSDHQFERTDRFVAGIRTAVRAVESHDAEVVLLGVTPSAPVSDYGWICPKHETPNVHGLRRVVEFFEKPGPDATRQLFGMGAVWNTMMLVGRASALLDLYRRHLPIITHTFLRTLVMDPEARRSFLRGRYDELPTKDFSNDILARAANLSLYCWPAEIGWSDLGTPERLARAGRLAAGVPVSQSRTTAAMTR